jgi:hypothetical protein
MEMPMNCVRCGSSAFTTLKIEAAIGATRLKIKEGAAETGLCAQCVIELAEWLNSGKGGESRYPAISRSRAGRGFLRYGEAPQSSATTRFDSSSNL